MESKKKYFCKYLPVEGEIKEGDYYKHREDGYLEECIDTNHAKLVNKKGHQRVKLFLCSRDIQVGDMVFVPNQEEAGNVIDGMDLLFWKEKKAYKIIGDISPEATWVKEGDQFDKESLCRLGKNIIMFFNWSDNLKDMRNCYVAIQCPTCKKFH